MIRTMPVLCAFFLLFSCAKPLVPEYKCCRNVSVQKADTTQSKLSFDLVFFNPNGYGVKMKETEVDIYVDGTFLGHTSLKEKIRIPRKADFTVPVSLLVNIQELLRKSMGFLIGKEVTVKATGTTKIGKAFFYKNMPVDYEGKQKFSLF